MPEAKIELKDLMALASYRTLESFDASSLKDYGSDDESMIKDVADGFSSQFKINLQQIFQEQLILVSSLETLNQLDVHRQK